MYFFLSHNSSHERQATKKNKSANLNLKFALRLLRPVFVGSAMASLTGLVVFFLRFAVSFFAFFFFGAGFAARFVFIVWLGLFLGHNANEKSEFGAIYSTFSDLPNHARTSPRNQRSVIHKWIGDSKMHTPKAILTGVETSSARARPNLRAIASSNSARNPPE